MNMKSLILFSVILFNTVIAIGQSPSKIREFKKTYITYPFSDPDPIASQTAIYPYFRFEGFTNTPINREWTIVELENDFIKIAILPEIGGKIWTAIDKTTGKAFLYDNKVIKFRDIAMRGPWTSGGLEPNYGIIGHTPNCATPVDYITKSNENGSVSCFVGVLDLLTRTRWQIEINLPKDKAYFTTNSIWNNPTSIGQPYYHWMNTGIKTEGNLEFIFPGSHYIGHEGEHATWPINQENGKKINFYEENDFGTYKSYHVIGKHTDFFGAYWHDDKYGMVRYAPYDEKVGKKIWIWGLSRQGMIWDKILTDTDGQYAEVQSGRLFNQNAVGSSMTPFKHLGFTPHSTDRWTEYWYPVNHTQGMVVANSSAAFNVKIENGWLKWFCSPVAFFKHQLEIRLDGQPLLTRLLEARPLVTIADSIKIEKMNGVVSIKLSEQNLEWTSDPEFKNLSRPLDAPKPYDWKSAEGLAIQAKELMDQKLFTEAATYLKEALLKDPHSMLALIKMAELSMRNGDYQTAFEHAKTAISFDAHHGAANYYYGLSAAQLGKEADAMDGFGVASMNMEYRSAAYVEIAKLHARNGRWNSVLEYAEKATEYNKMNTVATSLKIIAHRMLQNTSQSAIYRDELGMTQPLNTLYKWEKARIEKSASNISLLELFKNELPEESLLELASFYTDLGLKEEAIDLLTLLPDHPLALYLMAYLKKENISESTQLLDKANTLPTLMVFPFRTEDIAILRWATEKSNSWKSAYYLSLILHDKNKHEEAEKLLLKLGTTPDAAHVYAVRALWNKNDLAKKEDDLKRAMKLDSNSWRYPKLLAQHYIQQSEFSKALLISRQYKKDHPGDNFIMDMLLAKTLLLNKQYKSCDSLLALMDIIPFEGSTDGRALYWEAKMMQALQAIKLSKFKTALGFIKQASEWPENLGVGKPYDTEIDIRLEQYLSYICLLKLKQKNAAEVNLDKILAFNPGIHNTIKNFQPANHLVTKWASDAKGNKFDWNTWMNNQMNEFPQFKTTFNWVKDRSEGKIILDDKRLNEDPWMRVIYEFSSK